MPVAGERKVKDGILGEFDGTTWRAVAKPGDQKTKDGVTAEWDGSTWMKVEGEAPQAHPNDPSKLPKTQMKNDAFRDPNAPSGDYGDSLWREAKGAGGWVLDAAKGLVTNIGEPNSFAAGNALLDMPGRFAHAATAGTPEEAGAATAEGIALVLGAKGALPKGPALTEVPGMVSRGFNRTAGNPVVKATAKAAVNRIPYVGGVVRDVRADLARQARTAAQAAKATTETTPAAEMGLTSPQAEAARTATGVNGIRNGFDEPLSPLDIQGGRMSAPQAAESIESQLLNPEAAAARARQVSADGPNAADIGGRSVPPMERAIPTPEEPVLLDDAAAHARGVNATEGLDRSALDIDGGRGGSPVGDGVNIERGAVESDLLGPEAARMREEIARTQQLPQQSATEVGAGRSVPPASRSRSTGAPDVDLDRYMPNQPASPETTPGFVPPEAPLGGPTPAPPGPENTPGTVPPKKSNGNTGRAGRNAEHGQSPNDIAAAAKRRGVSVEVIEAELEAGLYERAQRNVARMRTNNAKPESIATAIAKYKARFGESWTE